MANNFLIGNGNLLTERISPRKSGGPKEEVYSFLEAKNHLLPLFTNVASDMAQNPPETCPDDYGVLKIVLNPSYIAKSYYPDNFFRNAHLIAIGSEAVTITPRKWSKKEDIGTCKTSSIFVAGKRSDISKIPSFIKTVEENSTTAKDLRHLETVENIDLKSKLLVPSDSSELYYEVVLHLLPGYQVRDKFPFLQFCKYAESLEFKVHKDLRIETGNLLFAPIEGKPDGLQDLSKFAFIRLIRSVPRLRSIEPLQNFSSTSLSCSLPSQGPISLLPRVAILDGGLPEHHPIRPWIKNYHLSDPDAHNVIKGPEHGLGVSSAFLFGPIDPGTKQLLPPFAPITHIRILDDSVLTENPLQLYRMLQHIQVVLLSNQYDFINLSSGPDLPIEDNQIHAWTAVIDGYLSSGNYFMTIAAGNNGERDEYPGCSRIQVPADCVNGVTVGAADSDASLWKRAQYSALGPGRRPGLVKPDLVAFGGQETTELFHVLAPGEQPVIVPQQGTSYAAPYLLRNAVAIRAILGSDISILSIKALLIHTANRNGHDVCEVGWGKAPKFSEAITCQPGVARIVYQGFLISGKYIRAKLPIPANGLSGKIKLKATFCFSSAVEPENPITYTQSALEIVFRPDINNKKQQGGPPKSQSFFSKGACFADEEDKRSNLNKWENVLHAERSMHGSKLIDPVFDIHYIAREGGAASQNALPIPYSLILTIESPQNQFIFNEILARYKELIELKPQVELPVTV